MRKSKKALKQRNRIITLILVMTSGYVLLVNNSLDFLIKFGINVNQNAVAFIGFFVISLWGIWKAQMGEL